MDSQSEQFYDSVCEADQTATMKNSRKNPRLPQFWVREPKLWFLQAEAAFQASGVESEQSKFAAVLAALDMPTAKVIEDIICTDSTSPYSLLKEGLIKRLASSDESKLRQLLSEVSTGDLSPSQALRHMQQLNNGALSVQAIHTLWLQRLPPTIQLALIGRKEPHAELAEIGDKMWESLKGQQHIAQVTGTDKTSLQQLTEKVDHLLAITSPNKQTPFPQEASTKPRDKRNLQGTGASPTRDIPPSSSFCWYHATFGKKARHCNQPCSFVTSKIAAVDGATHTSIVFKDKNSNLHFVLDTGASVSVLRRDTFPPDRQLDIPTLFTITGIPIPTFGTKTLSLNIGFKKELLWQFVVADVQSNLIGIDFVSHFGLLIDSANRTLINPLTEDKAKGFSHAQCWNMGQIIHFPPDHIFADILRKYQKIFDPKDRFQASTAPIEHFIETTGAPVFAKPRRLPPDKLTIAKNEFQRMVQMGICRPSSSPWASPLHMVPKKDGTWRPCGDFRQLNRASVPDRYPIPHIADFHVELHNNKIFSKIDLVKAFFHIPVNEADIPKTAITTPFGMFEFTRLPFGLRNASQTFQRFMHYILKDLPFAYAYIDDILIASPDEPTHRKHVDKILQVLEHHGLQINLEKSIFAVRELSFLGYSISEKGIKPLPDRVKAIKNFPKPSTIAELRRFLGLVNFYRRCLPHAAQAQDALYKLIPDNRKKDKRPVIWSEMATQAFDKIKHDLCQATLLAHPIANAQLSLVVDASSTGLGATLQQEANGVTTPLGFYSRTLTPAETKYATYDRELLAAYASIRYFRQILEGRPFFILTDHRPLTFAFQQNLDKASPRQTRHLDFISQFTTDIRYIAGPDNEAADSLSRIASISLVDTSLAEEIAKLQESDNELQHYLQSADTSLRLVQMPILDSSMSIYCDISKQFPRPFVPQPLRRAIFDKVHNMSHSSCRPTTRQIASIYVWPKMNSNIKTWCKTCTNCQRSKVTRHTQAELTKFAVPKSRLTHVHIDLIGPLPPCRGYNYCLTMIDRYTRWAEVVPLSDMTAPSVAEALYGNWIARFGVPEQIVTDQGRQFESSLFFELSKLLGFKKKRTTAYHPQCNGMIERFHRTLKAAIMATDPLHWVDCLPTVLLGLRTAIQSDSTVSAAELLYGEAIRIPAAVIESDTSTNELAPQAELLSRLREQFQALRPRQPRASKHPVHVPSDTATCSHIFLRNDHVTPALTPPYTGPHKVLSRNDKTVTIDFNGTSKTVSIDRIKPAHMLTDDFDDSTISTQHSSPPSFLSVQQNSPIASPIQANPQTDIDDHPSTFTRAGRRIKLPARYL